MPLDSNRVQAVFGAVLESDSAANRAAVLDRECATDAELRRRVEASSGSQSGRQPARSTDRWPRRPKRGTPDETRG